MLSLCYPPETRFGIGYKLFLKGVEMSKFFNFKIALPVAISVIGSGSALAALNCTTQPTCEQLGYSKTVDSNCEDYILCPFDTSYKACTKIGEVRCADYPFEKCPEGASCISCDNGTSLVHKVESCDAFQGYIMDGNTCHQVCAEPVYLSESSLPTHSGSDEYGINTYKGKKYYCFYGCDYNMEDGYDTYDSAKNECLPTDCSAWFGNDLYVEATSRPSGNSDLECKSGDTMYYSCVGNYINGSWQKGTYDAATNTCESCAEYGYTDTSCPDDDECDTCISVLGISTYYKRQCKGYNMTEKPIGSSDKSYESCFDGETTKYKCAVGYADPFGGNTDCFDCSAVNDTDLFSYCPDPTGEGCIECPTASGKINYFFYGNCPDGYFWDNERNYGYDNWGCFKDGTMICDGEIDLCVADCIDPWSSGSCPYTYDGDPVSRCYTGYNCHTYRNGKYYRCGKTGCQS